MSERESEGEGERESTYMRAYTGGQESEDTFESHMRQLERLYQQIYQQKVCVYMCVSIFQKVCVSMFQTVCISMFQKVCVWLCLRLCQQKVSVSMS